MWDQRLSTGAAGLGEEDEEGVLVVVGVGGGTTVEEAEGMGESLKIEN